tara:strand:- start:374 stop:880 length:507 start_codon:yes stop_codon:yes gene_type:complete
MLTSLTVIFSILSVISAIMCALSSKIIRTTFFFGVTLFLISFVFITIGSTMLGIIQILLYTGGTLILFLFAVILTADWDYNELSQTFSSPIKALIISFVFFLVSSYVLTKSKTMQELSERFSWEFVPSSESISTSLFTDWYPLLEIASILLLGTIIGCLVLLKLRKGE